ncbi:MAG: TetR/AcrR family transcriptional regulator [Thermoleophilaceae bacterium]
MAPELAVRTQRAEPIFAAAERLFAEHGYRAVSLAEVAGHVGLPEQHVYNYVGSKETLLLACFKRGRRRLLEALDAPDADLADSRRYLEQSLAAILMFFRDHREAWEILETHARTHGGPVATELARARSEFARLLSQLLAEVRAVSGKDPGSVNTETTAFAIIGALDAVGTWWAANPDVPPTEVAAHMAGALWGGLSGVFAG